jgi:hypothetical protein
MIIRLFILSILLCSFINGMTMSSEFVSGVSGYAQSSSNSDKFDSAINFSIDYPLNSNISFHNTIFSGLAQSSLGFSPASFDFALSYHNTKNNFDVVMGSYDVEFGDYSLNLSNNASFKTKSLIVNPLMFSFLASSAVSNIGAIGMLYKKKINSINVSSGLFNNINSQSSSSKFFGKFVNLEWDFTDQSKISLAALASNDFKVATTFNSDIYSLVITYSTIVSNIAFRSYLSGLNYTTKVGTSDSVLSYLLEASTKIKKYTVLLRYDVWAPESSDSGTIGLSNPSILSTSSEIRGDVSRLSLGLSYPLDNMFELKSDLIYENYHSENDDIIGLITYTKVVF